QSFFLAVQTQTHTLRFSPAPSIAGTRYLVTSDLTTNPCAPTSVACRDNSLESCCVTIKICDSGTSCLIMGTAWRPVILGMLTSRRTISGCSSLALSPASCPSTASPQTSQLE